MSASAKFVALGNGGKYLALHENGCIQGHRNPNHALKFKSRYAAKFFWRHRTCEAFVVEKLHESSADHQPTPRRR